MKINYSDVRSLADNLADSLTSTEFVRQVVDDGGQIFFGVVSPGGVRFQMGLNKKKFDKMMEEDDE